LVRPGCPPLPRIMASLADCPQADTAMVSGVIRLGEVAASIALLQVACNRCPRAGQLRTDRLLAEHGADLPMPRLRELVAADCPRMQAAEIRDPCGTHFPQLAAVFRQGGLDRKA
jgi:hypothetical protein